MHVDFQERLLRKTDGRDATLIVANRTARGCPRLALTSRNLPNQTRCGPTITKASSKNDLEVAEINFHAIFFSTSRDREMY